MFPSYYCTYLSSSILFHLCHWYTFLFSLRYFLSLLLLLHMTNEVLIMLVISCYVVSYIYVYNIKDVNTKGFRGKKKLLYVIENASEYSIQIILKRIFIFYFFPLSFEFTIACVMTSIRYRHTFMETFCGYFFFLKNLFSKWLKSIVFCATADVFLQWDFCRNCSIYFYFYCSR